MITILYSNMKCVFSICIVCIYHFILHFKNDVSFLLLIFIFIKIYNLYRFLTGYLLTNFLFPLPIDSHYILLLKNDVSIFVYSSACHIVTELITCTLIMEYNTV